MHHKLRGALLALGIMAMPAPQAQDLLLPDLGTAGIRGLTVSKEREIGELFMRSARAALPIINDPVMSEYLNTVGGRLISSAENVRFPFEFFLVSDNSLNASAFLGGKIQVNSGLFHYAETEDEFASVLAHEITHVTQRHIARFIESEMDRRNLTIGGVLGSILLGVLNPMAGMAAMSTTMGASMQGSINFTRDNEREADRIGLTVLQRAGYSAEGMISLFRRLMAVQGNVSRQFALLIDHPLSEDRLSEATQRAAQLPKRPMGKGATYDFARARMEVRHFRKGKLEGFRERLLANPEKLSRAFRLYALALIAHERHRPAEAREHLMGLSAEERGNIFVVDLLTDLDLESGHSAAAIGRLQPLQRKMPRNGAVALNLANAYLKAKRPQEALSVLRPYLTAHPTDQNALELTQEASLQRGDRCHALEARGDALALTTSYQTAQRSYNEALSVCRDQHSREVIRAKSARLMELRKQDEELQKGL